LMIKKIRLAISSFQLWKKLFILVPWSYACGG
jgi:hypothetical protein